MISIMLQLPDLQATAKNEPFKGYWARPWLRKDWKGVVLVLGPLLSLETALFLNGSGRTPCPLPVLPQFFRVPEKHPSCMRSLLSQDGRDLSVQSHHFFLLCTKIKKKHFDGIKHTSESKLMNEDLLVEHQMPHNQCTYANDIQTSEHFRGE